MMIEWTRNPALEEELFARLRLKYLQDRTKEIHFSDALYCLTKAYWSKTDPLPFNNETLGMFAIGFALEEVLLRQTPSAEQVGKLFGEKFARQYDLATAPKWEDLAADMARYFIGNRIEPYQYEDVWFSPDYTMTAMVGEMDLKSTRMWSEPDGRPKIMADRPHGFPEGWLKQFMGYAHRLGPHKQLCRKCEGNRGMGCEWCGATGNGPDYVDYSVAILYLGAGELVAGTIRFEWEEVELNMLHHLHRASILEDQLAKGQPPTPFMYNEAWECKNCHYFNRCKATESAA